MYNWTMATVNELAAKIERDRIQYWKQEKADKIKDLLFGGVFVVFVIIAIYLWFHFFPPEYSSATQEEEYMEQYEPRYW